MPHIKDVQISELLGVSTRQILALELLKEDAPLPNILKQTGFTRNGLVGFLERMDIQYEFTLGGSQAYRTISALNTRVGLRIVELRTLGAVQIERKELADRAMLAKKKLAFIEAGSVDVTLFELSRIAKALKTTVAKLVGPEETKLELESESSNPEKQ